jgi:hypothetical protein
MTRTLTATSAKTACETWTRSVGVAASNGSSPAIAPHVPSAPTRKLVVAAPAAWKRRAAQRRNGKRTYE